MQGKEKASAGAVIQSKGGVGGGARGAVKGDEGEGEGEGGGAK